jgi:hypothetical protein
MTNNKEASPQPLEVYIRIQASITAIINMIVNPSLAWLGNMKMEFVPFWGGNCLIIDTIITSIVLSVIVALFSGSGARRDIKAGNITIPEKSAPVGTFISRLPKKAWKIGLLFGLCSIIILLPATAGIFHLLGISGIPFAGFALFKAVYTGPLAYIVSSCVIKKEMELAGKS